MAFSEATKRRIAVRDGGMCLYPRCGKKLVYMLSNFELGDSMEFAHICAPEEGGPRWDPDIWPALLNLEWNGITLCGDHHKRVDTYWWNYPPKELRRWLKQSHAQYFSNGDFELELDRLLEKLA